MGHGSLGSWALTAESFGRFMAVMCRATSGARTAVARRSYRFAWEIYDSAEGGCWPGLRVGQIGFAFSKSNWAGGGCDVSNVLRSVEGPLCGARDFPMAGG